MSFQEMAEELEMEKEQARKASSLAGTKPESRASEASSSELSEPEVAKSESVEVEPALSSDPTKPPLVTPNRDLSKVPTTLEQLMALDQNERNANEVIGVLIAAHEKEAMAVLERTYLTRDDVNTVGNAFNIAKFGIGGSNPELNKPIPEVSSWIITKLRALRSVEGKSTEKFVESWQRSEETRWRQFLEMEKKKNQQFMGA